MAKLKPISTLISVLIISLAVGYVLAVWQEPSEIPPEGNVSAPINVGPEAQVKEGSPGTIAAGGFLGQVPGYGIYPDLGGASTIGSSLTITGSTSYLKLPQLTTAQRDALSPETGMIIYNTTVSEVQVYVPTEWKKLAAGIAVGQSCTLPGECDSGYCVDGYCCDSPCAGLTCQTCGLLSMNGAGRCGYVASSTDDPDNECAQGSTAADGCKSNTCSGSSYACGIQTSGDAGCPVCGTCAGATSFACKYYAAQTYDSGCSLCRGCNGYEIGSCSFNPGTTGWSQNLYGCTGSKRCLAGTCVTCSGSLLTASAGVCGQGGSYCCWKKGASSQTCHQVCSGGGCLEGVNWDDTTTCTVCKTLVNAGYSCANNTTGRSPYWYSGSCYYRGATAADCAATIGSDGRLCVCNW